MSHLNHFSGQLYAGRGKVFATVAGFVIAIVALIGTAMQLALPAVAFAQETTTTINGTMVVKLQESTAKSVIASTGDALGFLIAGIVMLMLGVLYLVYSSRKIAKVSADLKAGAHASSVKHGKQTISKKAIIIAVVAAMLASCCFGMFANRQATIAAEIVSQTNSTVLVDNNGKVLNSSIVVENAGEYPLTVTGVTAPAELNDWTASVTGNAIAPSNNVKGTWNGTQISDDLLKQLKAHKGEVELTYTVDLKCEDGLPYDLNFDKFTVDTEGKTYQASQIKPSVTAEGYTEGVDYTVTYGDNHDVGQNAGTIKITGIGNYSGEKEYTFHINKKIVTVIGIKAIDREYDGTSDVDFDCSEVQINGLCGSDTLEVIAGGELDDATVGKKKAKVLTIDLIGDLSGNYGVEEFTSIELDMEITQRTAELIWYSTSFKYDGTTHQPIASVSNSIDGEVPVVTVEGGQSAAGTYTATATAIDDPNYKLPDAVTQEFMISPLKVSVSGISAEDKVYDRTTDATFDATHAALDGIKEGDDVALDITNAKCKFDSADAGENKKVTISGLTLSGAAKDNYVFEQEGA